MSPPALRVLHEALRESLRGVRSGRARWAAELRGCASLLGSVGNLAEQLRALDGVRLRDTPLGGFQDLEERLRFKLVLEVCSVLDALGEKMSSLQAARDSISSQVSAVVQFYEENLDVLDLHAMVERSATVPSVADMMAWLQDAERHYRRQFLRRKVLLQSLRGEDLGLLESAPSRWKALETPGEEERIEETFCRVSLFLEPG